MTDLNAVEAIFFAALEKPAADRAAFLDGACRGDPDLRQRVERLLTAHPDAGGFLQPVAAGPDATTDPAGTAPHPGPGDVAGAVLAGRYKLVEPIGEGGMGAVWMAQQTEPVKRLVAVKLIKAGMDSKAVLARFEAERQALALMDHPNIAKVLDGGLTPDGRPFFVMELVKGVPITEFCDARRLTPRERLELFVPACQAIQHAHQKGIIHRDIKPSNVLVALYDDRPVPKVIDFGIAKAAGQPLTEKTLHTGFGAVVGTPEYMSPEQATFNQLDVDTRSDVYALGVLLYELLAGSPPFRRAELEKAGLLEVLRVIREQEPPRPSTRLSTADALATLSANRGVEPRKLTALVRGELDWIVMKALEKDRTRRYETAAGFAADVLRYLAGEPVSAVPPSAGYRLRKFARKHRVLLTTMAAFAGLLVAAAGVSGWLAVQARRAEATAKDNLEEASAQTRRADLNAAMLSGTLVNLHSARQASEAMAAGLQVDLDLVQVAHDPQVGLLRLCRTLKGLPTGPKVLKVDTDFLKYETTDEESDTRMRTLREFVTAAVLAAGQEYAPLLPPITHDGAAVLNHWTGPDGRTVLTLGADGTARLWDARTARPFAVLRHGGERVVSCGFSPDGRTVFTDAADVLRFWDASDGRLRGETRQPDRCTRPWRRPTAHELADTVKVGNDRLLTRRVVYEPDDELRGFAETVRQDGPVELWDAFTGRLVARLDGPGRAVERFQFLGGGRWVTTVEGGSTVLVYSADDGRPVARLGHPGAKGVTDVFASPSGRWAVTVSEDQAGKPSLRVWDTASWRDVSEMWPVRFQLNLNAIRFVTDDVIAVTPIVDIDIGIATTFYRCGQAEPLAAFGVGRDIRQVGDRLHAGNGSIYDARSWRALRPSEGRRFHPDLAKFAPDGRFVATDADLIDTRTDKRVPPPTRGGAWDPPFLPSYLPGLGLVAVVKGRLGDTAEVRILPPSDKLDLPPALLELWAQVAVRGEIGPDGEFVKWNEPTWERKRQELVAKPAPRPDLPLPGHLATDRLHWLRAEYGTAGADTDKLRIVTELLRRAEAAGDQAEAVRWRAEWAKYPETAPPPRPAK